MITSSMADCWSKRLSISLLIIIVCGLSICQAASSLGINNSMEYENCLGLDKPAGYSKRNPVTIIVNNWFGSAINGHIAKIILEEVVGVETILMPVENQTENWPLLASGDAHIALEIWATDSKELIIDFVRTRKAVVPAGPLGIIGEIGWYIPRYVQRDVPEVLFGKFSDADAAFFNNTFYLGSPEWSSYDQQIIDYYKWNITIQNLSGEDTLLPLILDKYANREPLLFYFWKPHPLHDLIDLVQIQLEDAVINGEKHPWYMPDILEKFVWAGLADYSYEGSFFANGFTYSNVDQTGAMAELLNGSTYTRAACNWVKNYEANWKMWVAPVQYQEVPESLQIAILVLASFSIAITVFYLVMTLVKFNTKVIVAASGTFLILMCIGGIFIYASVIAWATNTTEGCTIFEWLLATGFAVLFGSLFAKNARIYMLFSNKSLEVVRVSDRDIGLVVLCLVLIEWGILVAAQVIQGASYQFVNYGTAQYSFCIYHEGTGIALLVFNAFLIVVGILITALVSKLKLTLYNESKYMALAVYNFALVAIFFIVVFFVEDVVARFAVTCSATIVVANVSLGVIFVPKLKLLFKYTAEELQKMNDQQLNALIMGYTKKFKASSPTSSDEPRPAVNPALNHQPNIPSESSYFNAKDSIKMSTISSFEDEISKLLGNVRSVAAENQELKKENKELKAIVERLTEQLDGLTKNESGVKTDSSGSAKKE